MLQNLFSQHTESRKYFRVVAAELRLVTSAASSFTSVSATLTLHGAVLLQEGGRAWQVVGRGRGSRGHTVVASGQDGVARGRVFTSVSVDLHI